MLSREIIIAEAEKVRPGTFTRIGYKTELPVKSMFKKQGVSITKFVETSARLGVRYHRIAEVIARRAEKQVPRAAIPHINHYEWILKNKARHNVHTGKDYLYVAKFNHGHHTKSVFLVETSEGMTLLSAEEFMSSKYKHYVINSYWNEDRIPSEVKNISFENIYRVNCSGLRLNEVVESILVENEGRI